MIIYYNLDSGIVCQQKYCIGDEWELITSGKLPNVIGSMTVADGLIDPSLTYKIINDSITIYTEDQQQQDHHTHNLRLFRDILLKETDGLMSLVDRFTNDEINQLTVWRQALRDVTKDSDNITLTSVAFDHLPILPISIANKLTASAALILCNFILHHQLKNN